MRISDWSSDVCSSDLRRGRQAFGANVPRHPPSANASSFISPRRPAVRAGTPDRRLAGKPDSWRVGFPSFAPRPPRKSEGGGECPWVRNKGGGVGRRPIPGDIRIQEIGRAHVCTPVPNAHLVCRLLLEKKKTHTRRYNRP